MLQLKKGNDSYKWKFKLSSSFLLYIRSRVACPRFIFFLVEGALKMSYLTIYLLLTQRSLSY